MLFGLKPALCSTFKGKHALDPTGILAGSLPFLAMSMLVYEPLCHACSHGCMDPGQSVLVGYKEVCGSLSNFIVSILVLHNRPSKMLQRLLEWSNAFFHAFR